MKPLDQAFIKAYIRQDLASPPPLVVSTPAGHLAEAREHQLGVPGVARRVDPGVSAERVGQRDPPSIPAPYLETTSFAAAGEDSGTAADALADREAPTDPDTPAEEVAAADGLFRPMLQVDHYNWPKVCCQLGGEASDELDRLSDSLVAAMTEGRTVLAIGGCASGVGVTTMVLCAGRRLAERGHKVVMVDANLANPKLAKRLGLLPQFGWEEVLTGQLPLEEVVIESSYNQLAVLPLRGSFAGINEPNDAETRRADNLQTLAAHYDLVLIDLGPWEAPDLLGGWPARGVAGRLDAIVLVEDVRATTEDRRVEARRRLAAAEVVPAGIIQNFVRDHACTNPTGN